jgi:mono/diheme cytochrome c family protein
MAAIDSGRSIAAGIPMKESRMDFVASEMKPRLGLMLVLATLFAAWLSSCTSAPRPGANPARGSAQSQGERLYQVSCSGCHGANARGNGPVVPPLGAAAPDLTLLASRRGGSFPADEVYRIVDGQADLTAHGPRHMPVWGYEFFGDDADDEAAHREATGKIEQVVRFLQSLQRSQ